MATYKQPCIHCGILIDQDARFCSKCGSHSPFGYRCPNCLHEIKKNDKLCAGCGRSLYVECPYCGKMTFVQETCEQCGKTLMVPCINKHCGEMQFYQNKKCTVCGKTIKTKLK